MNGVPHRTIWMEGGVLKMIHQPSLPHAFEVRTIESLEMAATAIRDMWIRGAPAIGAAGAYGLALALAQAPDSAFPGVIAAASNTLAETRPTAQNLFIGIARVRAAAEGAAAPAAARRAALAAAGAFADEDAEACRRIGELGAGFFPDGCRVLTHCNAGWLATVDWGTALAPIYASHRAGNRLLVYADETRPRGQGSNLTAFELGQEGVPHFIIADNAAGHLLARGEIDAVIVGADRIAANGDAANKIGTYTKALAAREAGVPFYVAAPMTTVDFDCPTGAAIPIEERSPDEVLYTWGKADDGVVRRVRTAPESSRARNPAFDVTPADLIAKIITERGAVAPGGLASLR